MVVTQLQQTDTLTPAIRPGEWAITSLLKLHLAAQLEAAEAAETLEALSRPATGDGPAGPIRAWLDHHGGTLTDGERGIVASLERRTGPVQPAAGCPDRALRWLAERGCLRVDVSTFAGVSGADGGRVGDFLLESPGETRLRVDMVPSWMEAER